jgi:toxin-antitoxin system PIN domain toxin
VSLRSLLDVNVLVALLDADHVNHRTARRWLEGVIEDGWASCALTQNGFVRVLSQPRYPSPVTPAEAADRLAQAIAGEHHAFWPCSISVLDAAVVDRTYVHGPRQITDVYLLALATANGGRFVTFDDSVPLAAVVKATPGNLLVI